MTANSADIAALLDRYERELALLGDAPDSTRSAEIRLALSRLYWSRGATNPSASDLLAAIDHASQGLAAQTTPGRLRASLQQALGDAECALYDHDGQRDRLNRGLEVLRAAAAALDEFGSPAERYACENSLATALVRTGEQQSSVALLREALAMFGSLLPQCRLYESEDVDAEARLLSKQAVGTLRIGSYTGDSHAVEQAVRQLQSLLSRPTLSDRTRGDVLQNLCTALLENARQHRSQRVYEQVLETLAGLKLRSAKTDRDANLLFHRAQTRTELSRVTGDARFATQALEDLTELVRWHHDKPASRLTVLHAIAQAHFQLGKLARNGATEHFRSSIRATRAALGLTQRQHHRIDTRRHRLLHDLGTYTQALGITLRDPRIIDDAVSHFESALQGISAATAPALYAQMVAGLFYLHFSRQRWAQAAALFDGIEAAWDEILSDPALSSAVYQQQIRDLSGQYARAAWCHWALHDLARAAETLDRGRSRTLLRALAGKAEEPLRGADREALARAKQSLEQARATQSDREILIEWHRYLSLRRKFGLDGVLRGISAAEIRSRTPAGGAIVQIMILPGYAALLISIDGRPEWLGTALPGSTAAMIDGVFQGSGETPGWKSAYGRYMESQARKQVRTWRKCVITAMQTVAQCLIEVVHSALLEAGLRPGAPVVLSLPGPLAPLPVACAPLKDGRSFNEVWDVSLVPSLSSLSEGPPRGPDSLLHRVLVVAGSEAAAARKPRLPFAERESLLIARRFANERRSSLSSGTASLNDLLQGMSSATLLHACCHGTFDWQEPGNSGLELTEDRRLTINTLLSIWPRWHELRLAFLSSCESGLAGASSVPDEFLGIHCAFLQAGARAAIGSLWAVYDDTAMVFADRFYRYYLDADGREAMSPGRALSKAQHWLRNVTVKELIDDGLFSAQELTELLQRRSRQARQLRWAARSGKATAVRHRNRSRGPQDTSADMLSTRPYAEPTEWAGFVSIGR